MTSRLASDEKRVVRSEEVCLFGPAGWMDVFAAPVCCQEHGTFVFLFPGQIYKLPLALSALESSLSTLRAYFSGQT